MSDPSGGAFHHKNHNYPKSQDIPLPFFYYSDMFNRPATKVIKKASVLSAHLANGQTTASNSSKPPTPKQLKKLQAMAEPALNGPKPMIDSAIATKPAETPQKLAGSVKPQLIARPTLQPTLVSKSSLGPSHPLPARTATQASADAHAFIPTSSPNTESQNTEHPTTTTTTTTTMTPSEPSQSIPTEENPLVKAPCDNRVYLPGGVVFPLDPPDSYPGLLDTIDQISNPLESTVAPAAAAAEAEAEASLPTNTTASPEATSRPTSPNTTSFPPSPTKESTAAVGETLFHVETKIETPSTTPGPVPAPAPAPITIDHAVPLDSLFDLSPRSVASVEPHSPIPPLSSIPAGNIVTPSLNRSVLHPSAENVEIPPKVDQPPILDLDDFLINFQ